MSFILSFQFHSACLALRDLYSGLAIMIRMPQSKPCELFLKWQVRNRKKYPFYFSLFLPPFSLSLSLYFSCPYTQEIWIKYSWGGPRLSCTHMFPHSSSLQWTEASIQLVWHSRVWQRAWQHPSATYPHRRHHPALQRQIGCIRSDTRRAPQSPPLPPLWLRL